jgi:phosphoglycerate dehydrogenase-like enzyme
MWFDRLMEDLHRFHGGRVVQAGPAAAELATASAAVIGALPWDAAQFDLAPAVRVVARTGIGIDSVDLAEATRRGVAVTNTPEGPTVSTAEHAIALLFAVAKTIPEHQDRLRRGVGGYAAASTAVELDGLTLGLVAFGRIARRVARIAEAVGMEVIAHDPLLTADALGPDSGRVALVPFDELLARSDVLSIHCPLMPGTAGLFDAEVLARCKPGVILVNAARGGVVDHDALVDALDRGHVAAAGLDVTEPEPLDPGHTLLHRPNVVVTPHIASSTVAGRERMLGMAVAQALAVLDGQRPSCLVNPEVWPLVSPG